jgi:hypothetical protein
VKKPSLIAFTLPSSIIFWNFSAILSVSQFNHPH